MREQVMRECMGEGAVEQIEGAGEGVGGQQGVGGQSSTGAGG